MSRLGITEAFAKYGAILHNPQWSVSAWTPDGVLVVSLWKHHGHPGPPGTMEFRDSLARWGGPGNTEFRRNVGQAFLAKLPLKLVVSETEDTAHVQGGADAGRVRKEYFVREDLVGEVASLDGDDVVFRFRRA